MTMYFQSNVQSLPTGLDTPELHYLARDAKTGTGISYEIREISADRAALILSKNPAREDVDRKAVSTYAEAMMSDAWIYNAQPILFDSDGKLLDGRKRLMAAVMSGHGFRTLVVTGVNRDTVHTIDQHRRRSYAGVLEARAIPNAGALIRCMAKMIRITRGTFGKPSDPISWSRYDQVLDLNPELVEAVEMSEAARGCPLHSTARPVVAYMALKSGKKAQVIDMFRAMSDHEDLPRGNPAKELALQLAHDRSRGLTPEVDEMIVMGILALEDFANGATTGAPYAWSRDYGDCPVRHDGLPISRKTLIERTPANLGMPILSGYVGLDLGADLAEPRGTMIESLKANGNVVPDATSLILVRLTPDLAADWLERFNTSNRKIQPTHVNAIARDIRDGNWMMNAQPVAFNGDPWSSEARLLNGQHRLEAVVKADCEIEILVATGLNEAAFSTFDTHARHAHRKYVAKGDGRVLAAAAKLQWRVDNGMSPSDRGSPSASEIERTLDRHPDLVEAFPVSRKKEMQEIGSAGILTYFIAHIRREDDQLSDAFLRQLMVGEGLQRGNPVIKARTKLIGKRGDLSRRQVLTLLMETWDEYRAHVDVNGMASVFGETSEEVRFI